jgi:hypothetical protein
MSEPVALWYCHLMSAQYEICGSEAEAGDRAVSIEDSDQGAVLGVQFPDGSVLGRDAWAEYRAARERRECALDHWIAGVHERPRRQIRDPFDGRPVTAFADDPGWLGAAC